MNQTKDDRYADAVIGDCPDAFDAIEIHGVMTWDDGTNTQCEIDDDSTTPDIISVYVHLVEGGIDCVGDFSTPAAANGYASELAKRYGWTVYSYHKAA